MSTTSGELYAELMKFMHNNITADNVMKAIIFCMKYMKKDTSDGEVKKQIVTDVILLALRTAKIDVMDRESIGLIIDQVYEMLTHDFKRSRGCC